MSKFKKFTPAQKRKWILKKKKEAIKFVTEEWPDCCKNCEIMKKRLEIFANEWLSPKFKVVEMPIAGFKECEKCKKLKSQI